MRHFLIHFLVLTLIGSGFAYAADSHDATETHTPDKTELVSQSVSNHADSGHSDSSHDDIDEHHAHHGCHLSLHLIGLTSKSVVFSSVGAKNSFTSFAKTYISRLSVPPTKPPRS